MLLNKGTTYAFDEATTASTSAVQLVTKKIRFPACIESGDFLTITSEVWNSGAYTTYYYVYDPGSTTFGTEETNTNGTTHEFLSSTLTLGAWAGTIRAIRIYAKTQASGTAHVSAEDLLANMWFVAK